jgi:hypothetical protein
VRLDEHSEHVTVLVHSAPAGGTFSLTRDPAFVERLGVAELSLARPQFFDERRTAVQAPLAHGFVTDGQPAIGS